MVRDLAMLVEVRRAVRQFQRQGGAGLFVECQSHTTYCGASGGAVPRRASVIIAVTIRPYQPHETLKMLRLMDFRI